MAADDRKRRIMSHLAQSSDGMKYISPTKNTQSKSTTPAIPDPLPKVTPEPTPIAPRVKAGDRKRRIMDHVNQSSANFGNFSLDEKEHKRQVMEHVRKSLS
jgi:hypothetical protein